MSARATLLRAMLGTVNGFLQDEDIHIRIAAKSIAKSLTYELECKGRVSTAYRCKDCLDIHQVYMVSDSVWAETGLPQKGACLCMPCLELRLKRSLRIQDFEQYKTTRCNQYLFAGYAIGQRP